MGLGIRVYRGGDKDFKVRPGDGSLNPLMAVDPNQPKLIWIPAVPSSGTSCVAGILEALGVDMGAAPDYESRRRGYRMVEDIEVGMFTFTPNAPLDSLLNQRVRLREYINYRFFRAKRSGFEGRIGVKALATSWLYDLDPASLPVDVLDVHRPLEEAIVADTRRMAGRKERDPNEDDATAFQHMNRAGGVAANWLAKLMLFDIHPPKLSVDFAMTVANPEKAVQAIVEAFDLEPTERQVEDAVRTVEPGRKSL
jgi:hypothetical protein